VEKRVDTRADEEPRGEWFAQAIRQSTESLLWGIGTIPPERRNAPPPARLGEWTAVRQVFHLQYYEREVALPSVMLWLGGEYPSFEGYDESLAWENRDSERDPLEELVAVREEIIAALLDADEGAWQESKRTPWGEKTLYWVVSKTYQHGIEHLSGVLRTAMLWDHYASREIPATPTIIE
jgi:hypothetical protein